MKLFFPGTCSGTSRAPAGGGGDPLAGALRFYEDLQPVSLYDPQLMNGVLERLFKCFKLLIYVVPEVSNPFCHEFLVCLFT